VNGGQILRKSKDLKVGKFIKVFKLTWMA
jgi:hypothetical protein